MNSFSESNTVEQMILDAAAGSSGGKKHVWGYIFGPQLPRNCTDVMVEAWVREALIHLNPEIAAQPDRADEVIYNLRACILSVQIGRAS